MIKSLRAEIAKLQRVLDLLLDQPSTPNEVRRPGRPKDSNNRASSFNPEELAPKKRTMSAEGKARIAAAQKKRWAAQKASAVGGAAKRKGVSTKQTSQAKSPNAAGKVAPAIVKKSTRAGKRTGSRQVESAKRSTTAATRKTRQRILQPRRPRTQRPSGQPSRLPRLGLSPRPQRSDSGRSL